MEELKCPYCHGNFKEISQYVYNDEKYPLVIDDIKGYQCEFCGEIYFSHDVKKQIEKAFKEKYFSTKK